MNAIHIRWCLGDTRFLLGCMWEMVRYRDTAIMRHWVWNRREKLRRGLWRPYTLGDYVILHRKVRSLGRPDLPRPTPWRHRA